MEDNTEKCTICLSDFEDTEDVRYELKKKTNVNNNNINI